MEEQEVLRLFGLFTGLSEEEAAGWAVLCRSTIAELTGRLRPVWTPLRLPTGNAFRLPLPPWQPTATVCWAPVRPPTASRWGRSPSPPGAARGGIGAAAALQQEYLAAVRELVDTGAFCFERVRSHGI